MQPPKSHAAKPPKAGAWAACGMSMCREPSFCTENIYVKLNGKPVHCRSEWRRSLNLWSGDRKVHEKQYFKGIDLSSRNAQNWIERVGREKTKRLEVFIHLFVQQMLVEHPLAPGADQALGTQDPSRMECPLNSLKSKTTISCTSRREGEEKQAADKVLLGTNSMLCFRIIASLWSMESKKCNPQNDTPKLLLLPSHR